MPHPNVARFDVRVGVLTFSCLHVVRGGDRDVLETRKVKNPTLPNNREGWGTLRTILTFSAGARPPQLFLFLPTTLPGAG